MPSDERDLPATVACTLVVATLLSVLVSLAGLATLVHLIVRL